MPTAILAALKTVQEEMPDVNNRYLRCIEKQFAIFERIIHILRNLDQLMLSG